MQTDAFEAYTYICILTVWSGPPLSASELLLTVNNIKKFQRHGLDLEDEQDYLNLKILKMLKGTFLHDVTEILMFANPFCSSV